MKLRKKIKIIFIAEANTGWWGGGILILTHLLHVIAIGNLTFGENQTKRKKNSQDMRKRLTICAFISSCNVSMSDFSWLTMLL